MSYWSDDRKHGHVDHLEALEFAYKILYSLKWLTISWNYCKMVYMILALEYSPVVLCEKQNSLKLLNIIDIYSLKMNIHHSF